MLRGVQLSMYHAGVLSFYVVTTQMQKLCIRQAPLLYTEAQPCTLICCVIPVSIPLRGALRLAQMCKMHIRRQQEQI